MSGSVGRTVAWVSAIVAIALVVTARPAAACTTSSLRPGLTVKPHPVEPRRIATDGVLAFDAFVHREWVGAALARFSLTLIPGDGGPALTGETSAIVLATEPYDAIGDYYEIVLVWRPAAGLDPGAYTAMAGVQHDLHGLEEWSFAVEVDAAPAPPLSPPQVDGAEVDEIDGEVLERVCCEVGQSSCGESSMCAPTRVRVVPGFTIDASLAEADVERAYLWVAPWDGKAAGAPFARMNEWQRDPESQPWWSEWRWPHAIVLPDEVGESCIVVGATSLIDGSSMVTEPFCGELTAVREEERTPMLSPSPLDPFERECLTPPVYEHDGSPYPRQPEGGCRVTGAGSGWLVMLLLAGRRRRRGGVEGARGRARR